MTARPPDTVAKCRPHAWAVSRFHRLFCRRCGRRIEIATLEPWRRAAILRAVERRQGQAAADAMAGKIRDVLAVHERARDMLADATDDGSGDLQMAMRDALAEAVARQPGRDP